MTTPEQTPATEETTLDPREDNATDPGPVPPGGETTTEDTAPVDGAELDPAAGAGQAEADDPPGGH